MASNDVSMCEIAGDTRKMSPHGACTYLQRGGLAVEMDLMARTCTSGFLVMGLSVSLRYMASTPPAVSEGGDIFNNFFRLCGWVSRGVSGLKTGPAGGQAVCWPQELLRNLIHIAIGIADEKSTFLRALKHEMAKKK